VYIGGGTPTYLDEPLIARLLEALREHFNLTEGAKITLEAAPGTLSRSKLKLPGQLDINRLSHGIQILDEELLATMNRHYRVAEVERELGHALHNTLERFNAPGIPSLSIYALDMQRSVKGRSLFGPPRAAHPSN